MKKENINKKLKIIEFENNYSPIATQYNYSDDVISKNIQASELTMTETVKNHANDVIKRGKYIGDKARPFVDKAGTDLIIQEIIYGGIPVKDKYLPNGLRWEVEGTFNGRSSGIWELVVDLDTNQVVHFNFTNR